MLLATRAVYILTEKRHAYIIPPLMQALPVPTRINPWRLAAESGRLEGRLALAALSRLATLSRADGEVTITLVGGVDERGISFLEGSLNTEIELDCQRCLGPLRIPLTIEVLLGVVRSETEAERLPERYDPLLVADTEVTVADLVEDELLLALPSIPRHVDLHECEANGYGVPDETAPGTPLRQPFAVLASLLPDLKRST